MKVFYALNRNLLMRCSVPRRTLSLETLENRITPTLLGLTLPGPVADLVSHEALPLLGVSLTLPSAGQPGVGLGVDIGLLSLHAGVGTGGSLLSLGGKLDPPPLPPLSVQTGAGSPTSPLPPGIDLDPPAMPQGSGAGTPGVLPPIDVAVGTPAAPVLLPSPPLSPPAPPAPGLPGASVVASLLPGVASHPAMPVGGAEAIARPEVAETPPAVTTIAGNDFSSPIPHSTSINDLTFESFLPPRKPEVAGLSPRAQLGSDDLADELFRLREGHLLEDFGTAIAADEAVAADSETSGEPVQGESDGATALWLVGVLAGCVAGAAWLNRREEEATTPVDADPCLIPSD